jgi:hypothetical protein
MEYNVDKKEKFVVVSTTTSKLNTANAPDLKSEFLI